MHMEQRNRAGALMQIVDILRHDQHRMRPIAFEPRQRFVRGVGLDIAGDELMSARVVEGMYAFRIAGEGFGRRNLLDPVLGSNAIRIAEGVQAGFLRDSRTRENNDRPGAGHG